LEDSTIVEELFNQFDEEQVDKNTNQKLSKKSTSLRPTIIEVMTEHVYAANKNVINQDKIGTLEPGCTM
jgi:hypothetical protein